MSYLEVRTSTSTSAKTVFSSTKLTIGSKSLTLVFSSTMSNLHLVASLMDNFLRMENRAQRALLSQQQLAIQDLIVQVQVLQAQCRVMREELHEADTLIFDTNVRNWDLVEQNEILRRNNADLDYQLNGSSVSSPATTILQSSDSDTESEDLLSTHVEDQDL